MRRLQSIEITGWDTWLRYMCFSRLRISAIFSGLFGAATKCCSRFTSSAISFRGRCVFVGVWPVFLMLTFEDVSRVEMGVSKNRGTPKSSILIGVSIINHPFGYPYFWKHPDLGNSTLEFLFPFKDVVKCGQVHCLNHMVDGIILILHVLGSKSHCFPYNRGWSSTQ